MKKCFITSLVVGSHFGKPDMPGKFEKLGDYDYFLFTNLSPEKLDTSWEIKDIQFKNDRKSITNSRFIKFQAWKLLEDYDIIIYCDAWLRPVAEKKIWDKVVELSVNSESGLVQSPHPSHNCPYDEFNDILRQKKDSAENLIKTKKLFEKNKLERGKGLWEGTTFCYYTRNDKVKILFNKVWEFLSSEKYTHRDQPTMALSIHITGIKPFRFPCKHRCYILEGNRHGGMRSLFVRSGRMGVHSYE